MEDKFISVLEIPEIPEEVASNSAFTVPVYGDMEKAKDKDSIMIVHKCGQQVVAVSVGRIIKGYKRDSGFPCDVVIAEGLPKFMLSSRKSEVWFNKAKDMKYTAYEVGPDSEMKWSTWF